MPFAISRNISRYIRLPWTDPRSFVFVDLLQEIYDSHNVYLYSCPSFIRIPKSLSDCVNAYLHSQHFKCLQSNASLKGRKRLLNRSFHISCVCRTTIYQYLSGFPHCRKFCKCIPPMSSWFQVRPQNKLAGLMQKYLT